MKVWKNVVVGEWRGGLVIVAANTQDEAQQAILEDKRTHYLARHEICLKQENLVELPMLEAHVDKPQVLAVEYYIE